MATRLQYVPVENTTLMRMNATIQDLLALPDDEYRYEMIEGVIIRMPPPQEDHGLTCMRVSAQLIPYCSAHGWRDRLVAEVGYQLWGNKMVLAPDISITQVPRTPDMTYNTVAPLLAVEIASPSQSRPYCKDKAETFLRAGTAMVWVLWHETQTVDLYTAAGMVSLNIQDTLDGGVVLPGFTCPVASFFA